MYFKEDGDKKLSENEEIGEEASRGEQEDKKLEEVEKNEALSPKSKDTMTNKRTEDAETGGGEEESGQVEGALEDNNATNQEEDDVQSGKTSTLKEIEGFLKELHDEPTKTPENDWLHKTNCSNRKKILDNLFLCVVRELQKREYHQGECDNRIKALENNLGKLANVEAVEDIKQNMSSFGSMVDCLEENSKKIEGLEEQIKQFTDKLDSIGARKLMSMSEDESRVEEGDFPEAEERPETGPAAVVPNEKDVLNIDKLIKDAMEEEAQERRDDMRNYKEYLKEKEHWTERVDKLRKGVPEIYESGKSILEESIKLTKEMPSDLQEKLHTRQETLNLAGKMLFRLTEKIKDEMPDDVSIKIDEEIRGLSNEELDGILAGVTEQKKAQKRVDQRMKELSKERYKVVSQAHKAAEKKKKSFETFILSKLLPVIDGIVDGKKNALEYLDLETIKEENSDYAEKLDEWFATYDDLLKIQTDFLKEIKVYVIDVEIGQPVDYERHEALAVESSDEIPDEHIKEINRDGYEYETANPEEKLLLRSASVTVVKNS